MRQGTAFRVAGVASALVLAGVVLVAAPAAAAAKTTTTTVTGIPAPTGAPVVFTASVTHNTLTPTGTVTFTITGADSSTPSCDGGNVVALVAASTGSSAQCSIAAGLFASASPYAVTATYTPDDGSFLGSTGSLNKTIKLGPTTTTVTSPATPPVVTGEEASFIAQVIAASPSTGTPTGSVDFTVTGQDGTMLSCSNVGGNTQPLSGSDQAECDVAAGQLAASDAPYVVSAAYGGDPNFAASSGSLSQDVFKAVATIAVTSSASTLVTGQPVTFTATPTGVNPPGAGTPMGSVVFSVVGSDGTTETCDGGDTVALAGGSVMCTFSKGLPGTSLTYSVTATLQDADFKSPVPGTLTQQVGRDTSTVTVTRANGSPEASEPFSFNVAIKTASPGVGSPTGFLEWAVCMPNAPSCTPDNGTRGGTIQLPKPSANDKAKSVNKVTISLPEGLAPGFYEIVATYLGNAAEGGSTSPTVFLTVTQAPTTVQVLENHNPVVSGGKLRIRAAVIADANTTGSLGAPTGTVTFTITGTSGDTLTCSGLMANVETISSTTQNQGLATCNIAAGDLISTDGPYKIKAEYSGDTNYEGSKAGDSEVVDGS